MPAHMDDFNRNPMMLYLPDFSQADMDAGTSVVQPQTHFDKITRRELIRGSHLGTRFIDSQHATVCLKLAMHAGEHAVNGEIRNSPTGQLLSDSHSVKATLMRKRPGWLSLKRRGEPHSTRQKGANP